MIQPDWHSADIIAALKKQGASLSAVSRKSGLRPPRWQMLLTATGPKGKG